MEFKIRNLRMDDFPDWKNYINKAYGENHILTDWSFLNWFYGGFNRKGIPNFETLIAVLPKGEIFGSYGVLEAEIKVLDKIYSFCWYVSGNILPEFRNQGIGRTFVKILLEQFDICGVIGFNPGVKRNYQRAGFEFFKDNTLKRFILILDPKGYKLVSKIGFDEDLAKQIVPLTTIKFLKPKNIINLIAFTNGVQKCISDMKPPVKVHIVRSPNYLNWRYFWNPKIHYEGIAYKNGNQWLSYLTARRERFYPSEIYGTRIMDLVGSTNYSEDLLKAIIVRAKDRGDSLLEFFYTGSFYDEILVNLGFIELKNPHYVFWPFFSSPIMRKETNHEFICLGSQKYPNLFDKIEFNDLYFTRGDTDRDRANNL